MRKPVFILITALIMTSVSCNKIESEDLAPNAKKTDTETELSLKGKIVKYVKCQCLIYIKNFTSLPNNKNSKAADHYGEVLKANGYSLSSEPSIGDIVIFDRNFGGGINTAAGHIGRIVDVEYVSDKAYYKITIVSANWTNKVKNIYSECGCDNVEKSKPLLINTATKKKRIHYWHKTN